MNRQKLIHAYIELHSPNPAAISVVFNRGSFSHCATRAVVKRFQAEVDERRLGGRWYQKPASERLTILASPESFEAGHPHYHGLIRLPADDLERYGFEGIAALYNEQFAAIHDGGSLLIKPLTDPERWVSYCSKETDLINGDPSKVLWTGDFLPRYVRA